MSRQTHFAHHRQIVDAVLGIRALMQSWGLADDAWMLGKNVSLYLAGVFTDPAEISRDISVYVRRDRLTWIPTDAGRSVVPPHHSPEAAAYQTLETTADIGLDLMPVPDEFSPVSFVQNVTIVAVAGHPINVETPAKYLDRRLRIMRTMESASVKVIHDFYYANQERYQKRLVDFASIREWGSTHDRVVESLAIEATDRYQAMMRRVYPELFSESSVARGAAQGQVANGTGIIQGLVSIVTATSSPLPDRILVFSHFEPRDNPLAQTARAVVTDGGGQLSHAAIVCRELSIPCIVGTRSATSAFRDGDEVTVNCLTGEIRSVTSKEQP